MVWPDVQVGDAITLNRTNNWTETVTLEAGKEYTLVEDTEKAAVPGYNLESSWTDGTSVTLAKGDDKTQTVTNTYTQQTGKLNLHKTIVGVMSEDVALLDDVEVTVTISGNGQTKTVTLKDANGWHDSITLPVGEYTLTETVTEMEGYTHKRVTFAGEGVSQNGQTCTVTIGDNATVEVHITNTMERQTGKLTITKAFADGSDLKAADFASNNKSIDVIVKQGDVEYKTVTLPVNGAWYYTLTDVPVGTYTVEEVTDTAEVENYGLIVTYTNDDKTVTVTNSTTAAEMVVTNNYSRQTGKLTITKAFAEGSDLKAADFESNNKSIDVIVKQGEVEYKTVTLPVNGEWYYTLTDVPVGEYTVEEVTDTAEVENYGLNVSYTNDDKTVTVTNSTTAAEMVVTNNYSRQTGKLTISKKFAEESDLQKDAFSSINVEIFKGNALVKTILLAAENDWTWEETLPVGDYVVREVTEPDANGSAYRAGYGLSVSYNGEATGSVSVNATAAEMTITNDYTSLTGKLLIRKEFKGDKHLYPASVEFTVTGNGVSQKVTVSAANDWTARVDGLYEGEYTVTEALVSGADYDLTTTWSHEGGKITVTPGQTVEITCTNAYYAKDTLSFRIPVEKTVTLVGAKAPEGAMQFSFGATWQGAAGVTVRFENDPTNTLGYFQQTSANTYAVTLNGVGTVKGWIVIEGYADQLAGFTLKTWENLTGYADEEAAAAAGWTFDKTAVDAAVNWYASVSQNGLGVSITYTENGAAGKISFENVYTSPIEVPETGDGDNPALWAALCAISALGAAMLLVSHKRKAITNNR